MENECYLVCSRGILKSCDFFSQNGLVFCTLLVLTFITKNHVIFFTKQPCFLHPLCIQNYQFKMSFFDSVTVALLCEKKM